ncbi:MAG: type I phosphomannose isomerase catalytic subunit [Gilvibacter sp.]
MTRLVIPDYPLLFTPILKEKVWGGTKLNEVLGKESSASNVGESWELSGVTGNVSVVSNGELKGALLSQLIEQHGAYLLGERVLKQYEGAFPLLFKFIDAAQDLSVQVHPDDSFAKKQHDCFGKTEMWYVMQADPKAQLIVDFNRPLTKEQYLNALENKQLASVLQHDEVFQGDSYFIAPGTIHAICGGVMLAEIQQTSDITYRVYDWDRPEADGSFRELHNDLAIQTLNFKAPKDQKITYSKDANNVNTLYESAFFSTQFIPLAGTLNRDMSQIDSFVVYMCVHGQATITVNDNRQTLQKGQTCLIAAHHQHILLEAKDAQLLEVYVP